MKHRLLIVSLLIVLSAAACATPGLPLADTPTAALPTATLAPTHAPTQPPPTATTAPTAAATEAPTATTPPQSAQSGFACSVAYASGSKLFCLGEGGTPIPLADHSADGTLSDPLLSSDGAWVAYMLNKMDGTSQLWAVTVSSLAGNDGLKLPRQILADPSQFTTGGPDVAVSPLRPQWQYGTHVLFFSTRFTQVTGEQGPGDHLIGDLWRVDADATGPFNVLPRQSLTNFGLSPDGQTLALTTPQAVILGKPDGSNLRSVLDYPFINTASEVVYKPALVWNPDSQSLTTAIPSADPLGADAHVDFYRISADGSVEKRLTLAGNFVFGTAPGLALSPNGQFAIYGSIDPATQGSSLHLVTLATGSDTVITSSARPINGLGWSPDSNHYLYVDTGTGNSYAAAVEGPPQPLGDNVQVLYAVWTGTTGFFYVGMVNGQIGIYFQHLGEAPRVIAADVVNYAALDVRP